MSCIVVSAKAATSHKSVTEALAQCLAGHMSSWQVSPYALPPRSARTKCKVAPPSRLYSAAVLSSLLCVESGRQRLYHCLELSETVSLARFVVGWCVHLFAAIDQTLLYGWDAFLFFDTLLYARYLVGVSLAIVIELLARWGKMSRCESAGR